MEIFMQPCSVRSVKRSVFYFMLPKALVIFLVNTMIVVNVTIKIGNNPADSCTIAQPDIKGTHNPPNTKLILMLNSERCYQSEFMLI